MNNQQVRQAVREILFLEMIEYPESFPAFLAFQTSVGYLEGIPGLPLEEINHRISKCIEVLDAIYSKETLTIGYLTSVDLLSQLLEESDVTPEKVSKMFEELEKFLENNSEE